MATVAYALAAFSSNGTSTGIVTVASTGPFVAGATIFLSATGVNTAMLRIVTVNSATQLSVQSVNGYTYTYFDCSAFTVAAGATITQPNQEIFSDSAGSSPNTATMFTATTGSGTNAFVMNQGARFALNSTGTVYLSYDGTNIAFTGAPLVTTGVGSFDSLILTQTGTGTTISVPNESAKILSGVVDGGSAVIFAVDSTNTIVNGNAKIVSFRNGGSEKSYISADGSVRAPAFYSNSGLLTTLTSNVTMQVIGAPTDGSSAIGVKINTSALTTAGAKIASFQNNSVEKAYVDKDGTYITTGNILANFFSASSGLFTANSNAMATLQGTIPDGASSVGAAINSSNTLSTSGAKIMSIRNNGVEKAYFDKDGVLGLLNPSGGGFTTFIPFGAAGLTISAASTGFGPGGGNSGSIVAGSLTCDSVNGKTGNAPLVVKGLYSDGASAVSIAIDTTAAYTTSGAKIMSIRNNGVEKLAVGLDGQQYWPAASSVGIAWGTPSSVSASVFYASGVLQLNNGGGFWANQMSNGNTGAPNTLVSRTVNSGTVAANSIGTSVTQNIAGGRLLDISNNGTSVAGVDRSGGLYIGKLTTTAIDALAGADLREGTLVWDSTLHKLKIYTGTAWELVTSA